MKALTVRQPWASAIIHLGKDVENRTWKTNYRGRIAIHSAQRIEYDAMHDPTFEVALDRFNAPPGTKAFDSIRPLDMSTGVILGTVDIIGCHLVIACGCKWGQLGQWHWELANAQPLVEPVPAKGKLGLWNVPADLITEVQL